MSKLDYSKWDALELSDDSDIEVHPNIDKRSFIRWKQQDIHEKREAARRRLQELESSHDMNHKLVERIGSLVSLLGHGDAVSDDAKAQTVVAGWLDAILQSPLAAERADPKGPTYGEMFTALVDKVRASAQTGGTEALLREFQAHMDRLLAVQAGIKDEIDKIQRERKSKITSDDIHIGFEQSHVMHDKSTSKKAAKTQQVLETIHTPAAPASEPAKSATSGYESDESGEESIEPSELSRKFAQIALHDYGACLKFLTEHADELLGNESESDGLLIEAFRREMAGDARGAKQAVHRARILQYCRQLGRDGLQLFFRRVQDPKQNAFRVFNDDVDSTYARIQKRASELADEDRNKAGGEEGVEQIQLQAVDPDTQIVINVPLESDAPARAIFTSFPPALQRAIESKSLDQINLVLGEMAVDEAEDVVQKLGDGGMLSIESGIIDATKGDVPWQELARQRAVGDEEVQIEDVD